MSDLYQLSQKEPIWKRNYHLFQSKQDDAFIESVTPNHCTEQLLSFRPLNEIKQDIKLGIAIAQRRKDVGLLIRYLFALAELERRLYNFDPVTLTDEWLRLGKPNVAKNYLRTEHALNVKPLTALESIYGFIEFGDKKEAAMLFNLAYPDAITDLGINITSMHEQEEILMEWISVAPHFMTIETIFEKINNIQFVGNQKDKRKIGLKTSLLTTLFNSLLRDQKWDEFDTIMHLSDLKNQINKQFEIIKNAIEVCLETNDKNRANKYLTHLPHPKFAKSSI